MAFCNMCGAQIADGATTCAACSGRAAVPAAGVGSGQMADNVAGMLAYITFIPAIIFLVTAPYNKSRFVRFHSFQCLFLTAAVIILQVGLTIVTVVPFLIILTGPLHLLVALGSFILWIILLLKANQGLMWKLPVIGDMAEKQANAM